MKEETGNNYKMPISKIIIWIIVGVILTFIGIGIYLYFDDMYWENKYKDKKLRDDLLTVECDNVIESENTISCMINTKDKSNIYDYLSLSISHSKNIKYLSHNIPMPESQYNSHNITEHSYGVDEHYYISDYGAWDKQGALLTVNYTISNISLEDDDMAMTFDYIELRDR